ncbi:MAG: hypothetical protein LRZ85_07940 [Alphaproteobacteria bacterium]|nr:hypothetical protein [Alphaproteobacteria bacterium]MCD8525716.1 hypothetical protein [Alphaproteobacteria bacterium]MCD8570705.1 hypothetical protein [Alphaproteobacteria bacterium]
MIFRIFLAVFVLLAGAGNIYAQEVAPTCDITVQNQIKQQAWMEGQRELEIAQRLILKPDSVLEYSCFEQEARRWGTNDRASNWPLGNPGANAWNFGNFGGGASPPNLGNAIDTLVLDSLTQYLENYGHLFLGGTYKLEYVCNRYSDHAECVEGEPEENKSLCDVCRNNNAFIETDAENTRCNPHFMVWYLAKCANEVWEPDTPTDPAYFFPLQKFEGSSIFDILSLDVRDMPRSCEDPYKSDRNSLIQNIQTRLKAFPDATQNPPLGVDNASKMSGSAGGQTYKERLDACGTAVKTGFKVKPLSGESQIYDDAVCISPGCTYNGTSCSQ